MPAVRGVGLVVIAVRVHHWRREYLKLFLFFVGNLLYLSFSSTTVASSPLREAETREFRSVSITTSPPPFLTQYSTYGDLCYPATAAQLREGGKRKEAFGSDPSSLLPPALAFWKFSFGRGPGALFFIAGALHRRCGFLSPDSSKRDTNQKTRFRK